jgi:hypothetical protein
MIEEAEREQVAHIARDVRVAGHRHPSYQVT